MSSLYFPHSVSSDNRPARASRIEASSSIELLPLEKQRFFAFISNRTYIYEATVKVKGIPVFLQFQLPLIQFLQIFFKNLSFRQIQVKECFLKGGAVRQVIAVDPSTPFKPIADLDLEIEIEHDPSDPDRLFENVKSCLLDSLWQSSGITFKNELNQRVYFLNGQEIFREELFYPNQPWINFFGFKGSLTNQMKLFTGCIRGLYSLPTKNLRGVAEEIDLMVTLQGSRDNNCIASMDAVRIRLKDVVMDRSPSKILVTTVDQYKLELALESARRGEFYVDRRSGDDTSRNRLWGYARFLTRGDRPASFDIQLLFWRSWIDQLRRNNSFDFSKDLIKYLKKHYPDNFSAQFIYFLNYCKIFTDSHLLHLNYLTTDEICKIEEGLSEILRDLLNIPQGVSISQDSFLELAQLARVYFILRSDQHQFLGSDLILFEVDQSKGDVSHSYFIIGGFPCDYLESKHFIQKFNSDPLLKSFFRLCPLPYPEMSLEAFRVSALQKKSTLLSGRKKASSPSIVSSLEKGLPKSTTPISNPQLVNKAEASLNSPTATKLNKAPQSPSKSSNPPKKEATKPQKSKSAPPDKKAEPLSSSDKIDGWMGSEDVKSVGAALIALDLKEYAAFSQDDKRKIYRLLEEIPRKLIEGQCVHRALEVICWGLDKTDYFKESSNPEACLLERLRQLIENKSVKKGFALVRAVAEKGIGIVDFLILFRDISVIESDDTELFKLVKSFAGKNCLKFDVSFEKIVDLILKRVQQKPDLLEDAIAFIATWPIRFQQQFILGFSQSNSSKSTLLLEKVYGSTGIELFEGNPEMLNQLPCWLSLFFKEKQWEALPLYQHLINRFPELFSKLFVVFLEGTLRLKGDKGNLFFTQGLKLLSTLPSDQCLEVLKCLNKNIDFLKKKSESLWKESLESIVEKYERKEIGALKKIFDLPLEPVQQVVKKTVEKKGALERAQPQEALPLVSLRSPFDASATLDLEVSPNLRPAVAENFKHFNDITSEILARELSEVLIQAALEGDSRLIFDQNVRFIESQFALLERGPIISNDVIVYFHFLLGVIETRRSRFLQVNLVPNLRSIIKELKVRYCDSLMDLSDARFSTITQRLFEILTKEEIQATDLFLITMKELETDRKISLERVLEFRLESLVCLYDLFSTFLLKADFEERDYFSWARFYFQQIEELSLFLGGHILKNLKKGEAPNHLLNHLIRFGNLIFLKRCEIVRSAETLKSFSRAVEKVTALFDLIESHHLLKINLDHFCSLQNQRTYMQSNGSHSYLSVLEAYHRLISQLEPIVVDPITDYSLSDENLVREYLKIADESSNFHRKAFYLLRAYDTGLKDVDRNLSLAQINLELGFNLVAEVIYKKILQLRLDSKACSIAIQKLVEIYMEEEEWQSAVNLYDPENKPLTMHVRFLFKISVCFANLGQFKKALEVVKKIKIEKIPKEEQLDFLVHLADCHHELNQRVQLESIMRTIREKTSSSRELFFSMRSFHCNSLKRFANGQKGIEIGAASWDKIVELHREYKEPFIMQDPDCLHWYGSACLELERKGKLKKTPEITQLYDFGNVKKMEQPLFFLKQSLSLGNNGYKNLIKLIECYINRQEFYQAAFLSKFAMESFSHACNSAESADREVSDENNFALKIRYLRALSFLASPLAASFIPTIEGDISYLKNNYLGSWLSIDRITSLELSLRQVSPKSVNQPKKEIIDLRPSLSENGEVGGQVRAITEKMRELLSESSGQPEEEASKSSVDIRLQAPTRIEAPVKNGSNQASSFQLESCVAPLSSDSLDISPEFKHEVDQIFKCLDFIPTISAVNRFTNRLMTACLQPGEQSSELKFNQNVKFIIDQFSLLERGVIFSDYERVYFMFLFSVLSRKQSVLSEADVLLYLKFVIGELKKRYTNCWMDLKEDRCFSIIEKFAHVLAQEKTLGTDLLLIMMKELEDEGKISLERIFTFRLQFLESLYHLFAGLVPGKNVNREEFVCLFKSYCRQLVDLSFFLKKHVRKSLKKGESSKHVLDHLVRLGQLVLGKFGESLRSPEMLQEFSLAIENVIDLFEFVESEHLLKVAIGHFRSLQDVLNSLESEQKESAVVLLPSYKRMIELLEPIVVDPIIDPKLSDDSVLIECLQLADQTSNLWFKAFYLGEAYNRGLKDIDKLFSLAEINLNLGHNGFPEIIYKKILSNHADPEVRSVASKQLLRIYMSEQAWQEAANLYDYKNQILMMDVSFLSNISICLGYLSEFQKGLSLGKKIKIDEIPEEQQLDFLVHLADCYYEMSQRTQGDAILSTVEEKCALPQDLFRAKRNLYCKSLRRFVANPKNIEMGIASWNKIIALHLKYEEPFISQDPDLLYLYGSTCLHLEKQGKLNEIPEIGRLYDSLNEKKVDLSLIFLRQSLLFGNVSYKNMMKLMDYYVKRKQFSQVLSLSEWTFNYFYSECFRVEGVHRVVENKEDILLKIRYLRAFSSIHCSNPWDRKSQIQEDIAYLRKFPPKSWLTRGQLAHLEQKLNEAQPLS